MISFTFGPNLTHADVTRRQRFSEIRLGRGGSGVCMDAETRYKRGGPGSRGVRAPAERSRIATEKRRGPLMMSTTNKRRRGSARTAALAGATLLAALTMAGSASAQEIVVTGNSRVDAETIRSYVTGTASGSLEEARRNLLSTGMFSDVRIARSGGRVVVSVRENTVINRVVFEGSTRIKKEVLEGEVQAKARGPFSQAILQADIERLREIFRRTGRGNAEITGRVVDLPNGKIDVV